MIDLDRVLQWHPGTSSVRIIVDDEPENRAIADALVAMCLAAGVAVSVVSVPPTVDVEGLTSDDLLELSRDGDDHATRQHN